MVRTSAVIRRQCEHAISAVAVVLVCIATLGCGGVSTHHTASAAIPCPSGQTLISGHFHGQFCVARSQARVAFACREAQYGLTIVMDAALRDLQPGALRSEFESAARESAAVLATAESSVRNSGESASVDLEWLARHRAWFLRYEREAHDAHIVPASFGRWFRPFATRDLACQHVASVPWRGSGR